MLPAEPKAEADNTCHDLDYSGYHKKIGSITSHCWENEPALIQPGRQRKSSLTKKMNLTVLLYIVYLMKIMTNTPSQGTGLTLFLEIMHCTCNLQINH